MPLTNPIAVRFDQTTYDLITQRVAELNAADPTGRQWSAALVMRLAILRGVQEWGWVELDGKPKQAEPKN